MKLEENSKLNVAINFQFWVFGGRIDQLITVQVTKVPRGEDLSAEVQVCAAEQVVDFTI